MAVRRAVGRIVSVWRYHVLLPIVPFCSPSSLALRRKGFSLVHPFHTEIQCRCYQFSGALWSDAEAIHECVLFCLELSHAAR